tara:strand:+ start:26642 stop:27487 length:846 start_codon:yes stop_codon:yes gene_type:complete
MRHATGDVSQTRIPGVVLYRTTEINIRMPTIYKPSFCVLIQGAKEVHLKDSVFRYKAGEYLIASVDMPVIGRVVEASPATPYLCLQVELDKKVLSDIVISRKDMPENSARAGALAVCSVEGALHDCISRLIQLLDYPEDMAIVSPLLVREIHYRILQSDDAGFLRQLSFEGSHIAKIATAIQKIKADLFTSISMEDLAEQVGMSSSSFYAHFKAITHLSPLQFQKNLRLMEAKQLMLAEAVDATTAAYRVGYQSSSQFSREYSRLFGDSPKRDIAALSGSA